jgi:hypothetical protein
MKRIRFVDEVCCCCYNFVRRSQFPMHESYPTNCGIGSSSKFPRLVSPVVTRGNLPSLLSQMTVTANGSSGRLIRVVRLTMAATYRFCVVGCFDGRQHDNQRAKVATGNQIKCVSTSTKRCALKTERVQRQASQQRSCRFRMIRKFWGKRTVDTVPIPSYRYRYALAFLQGHYSDMTSPVLYVCCHVSPAPVK